VEKEHLFSPKQTIPGILLEKAHLIIRNHTHGAGSEGIS
jgi:hypothetical protein